MVKRVATEIVWLDVNVHDINTSSKQNPREEKKLPDLVGEVIKCRALKITEQEMYWPMRKAKVETAICY
jgi:hypothetical protein